MRSRRIRSAREASQAAPQTTSIETATCDRSSAERARRNPEASLPARAPEASTFPGSSRRALHAAGAASDRPAATARTTATASVQPSISTTVSDGIGVSGIKSMSRGSPSQARTSISSMIGPASEPAVIGEPGHRYGRLPLRGAGGDRLHAVARGVVEDGDSSGATPQPRATSSQSMTMMPIMVP